LRVPASRVARGLIERTGEPVAAPSANRSNRLSPTRAEHVLADLDGLIDLVVDSGPTAVGLESTVLDVISQPPRLLRPGPITSSELESALSGRPVTMPTAGETAERPSSPGQLPVHYSPRTPSFRVDSPEELVLIPGLALKEIALVSIGESRPSLPLPPGKEFRLESPAEAGRLLYEVLHQCDALKVRAIIVVMPADTPAWQAVRDRLLRATRPYPSNG
jgi:L-threonylcarbamoyladenylate synthase